MGRASGGLQRKALRCDELGTDATASSVRHAATLMTVVFLQWF
jgi:hypothetical protein